MNSALLLGTSWMPPEAGAEKQLTHILHQQKEEAMATRLETSDNKVETLSH